MYVCMYVYCKIRYYAVTKGMNWPLQYMGALTMLHRKKYYYKQLGIRHVYDGSISIC